METNYQKLRAAHYTHIKKQFGALALRNLPPLKYFLGWTPMKEWISKCKPYVPAEKDNHIDWMPMADCVFNKNHIIRFWHETIFKEGFDRTMLLTSCGGHGFYWTTSLNGFNMRLTHNKSLFESKPQLLLKSGEDGK